MTAAVTYNYVTHLLQADFQRWVVYSKIEFIHTVQFVMSFHFIFRVHFNRVDSLITVQAKKPKKPQKNPTKQIEAASSNEQVLAVHAHRGMLPLGFAMYIYSGQDPLHIWAIWSRWQIVCGSYNDLMVLLWSMKMYCITKASRCDVEVKAFDKFCPQMLLAKFGPNWSNGLGGVGKSTFLILVILRMEIYRESWYALHYTIKLNLGNR